MAKTLISHQDLSRIIPVAGRAPSGGNIQPWLVDIKDDTIFLKLNPKMLGTILDVNNYGSLYALGAFSFNLEVALSHYGYQYQKRFLKPTNPHHFQLTYTITQKGKSLPHLLFQAALDRDSNRKLHKGKLIDPKTISQLKDILDQNYPDFRLDNVSTNDAKSDMAKILGKADLIRTKNTTLLKQMMSELRWTDSEAQKSKDGIDIKTMELPGNVGKMLRLLSQFASLAKNVPDIALEKQAWPMIKLSSHLCVLSFKDQPTPQKMFELGYVMQHLWLKATQLNLSAHPWTVLTFFVIRAKYFAGSFFSDKEEALLLATDKRLRRLIRLPSDYTPGFIFRLSKTNPPSARSLRYHWTKYTTIK